MSQASDTSRLVGELIATVAAIQPEHRKARIKVAIMAMVGTPEAVVLRPQIEIAVETLESIQWPGYTLTEVRDQAKRALRAIKKAQAKP